MKANKLILQYRNGNITLSEIELTIDDYNLINDAVKYYYHNLERIETEMEKDGFDSLRIQAFYLRKDLQNLIEKIK